MDTITTIALAFGAFIDGYLFAIVVAEACALRRAWTDEAFPAALRLNVEGLS